MPVRARVGSRSATRETFRIPTTRHSSPRPAIPLSPLQCGLTRHEDTLTVLISDQSERQDQSARAAAAASSPPWTASRTRISSSSHSTEPNLRPISFMAAPHLPTLIRRIIVDRAQVERKVVLDEAAHQHDQENPARVLYAIRALYGSVAAVGCDVAGAALQSLGELSGLDPFMKEEVFIQGRTLAFAVSLSGRLGPTKRIKIEARLPDADIPESQWHACFCILILCAFGARQNLRTTGTLTSLTMPTFWAVDLTVMSSDGKRRAKSVPVFT
jgi:hypothetical protein